MQNKWPTHCSLIPPGVPSIRGFRNDSEPSNTPCVGAFLADPAFGLLRPVLSYGNAGAASTAALAA
jgi:hypothetical protein